MNTPVVLITGALTGIGRATAIAFAHKGARIVIAARRDEAGQKLAAELREIGVEAEYWRTDVVTRTICEAWSIRQSRASVGWISPSTTPRPRGRAVS